MKSMLSLDGRFLYLEDFRWLLDGHCQFSLKQKETNLSVETCWLHCQVHIIEKGKCKLINFMLKPILI